MNIRYAEILEMADRHVVMKQCMKEIADALGVSVTFMAKPHASEAGSSCHIHLSLWEGDTNVFPGEVTLGPLQVSDEFRWFLGGWMAQIAELMVFFAPTVNSYKRFQDGSWAPTRIAWSYDNRTAGFRVVGTARACASSAASRAPTSTPTWPTPPCWRPASTASSSKIEPPRHLRRRRLRGHELPEVPPTLARGPHLFAASEFAGRRFRRRRASSTTATSSRWSWRRYDNAVTDWERRRYFERI